ncbi:MAG TPA: hypothetical protein VHE99_01840 [Gammaproteobacteria bacterium]|nr:hypothetical protein [Gammaproteobacteria bacterium]
MLAKIKNKNITLSQINFKKMSKDFIEEQTITTSYVKYENQNLSGDILNKQYNGFGVDVLLKHQSIANDPLNFLFQSAASIATTECLVSKHSWRPLPLLNQYFDTQRTTVGSTENKAIIYETMPLEIDKLQGNILQELGIFSDSNT